MLERLNLRLIRHMWTLDTMQSINQCLHPKWKYFDPLIVYLAPVSKLNDSEVHRLMKFAWFQKVQVVF